jgi:phenylpropionate dioxygenase-like ring-hydroxylating dioxygenase large terminal subunit
VRCDEEGEVEEKAPSINHIARAIEAHRTGHALTRPFYCDPTFFELELRRLLLPHWHCVGHRSQLADPGDFFTVELFQESVMGQFSGFDGGVTFFDVGLTNHFLAYTDHGLIYRFVPQTVDRTDMEVMWLVRGDAREGTDYDVERLTWLWRVTSDADKRIIEANQQGVDSRWYEPGPYSQMEQHTSRFVEWILAELSGGM